MPRKKTSKSANLAEAEEDPRNYRRSTKTQGPKIITICGQRVTVDRNAIILTVLVGIGLLYLLLSRPTTAPVSPYRVVTREARSETNVNTQAAVLATQPTPLSFPKSPQCSSDEIKRQVDGFNPIKGRVWYWGCSPDSWWELVHEYSPSSVGKVFVDIGMNKGYVGGVWYGLWHPELKLNPQTLGKAVHTVPPTGDQDCGACGDCNDRITPKAKNPNPHQLIKVHGFDGAGVTVSKHHTIVRDYFKPLEGYWTSSNFAISDHTGTIDFPNVLSEVASIHVNSGLGAQQKSKLKEGMVTVNMTTVDTFMKDWSLDELFVLKVDTEGNDPSVIKGAQETLKNHKTHILQFEYHNLGLWGAKESLAPHVTMLDDLGYTCFLLGHDCVHILTGCWDPVFEFRTWSNVMCISRVRDMPLVEKFIAKSYAKQDPAKCPMPK